MTETLTGKQRAYLRSLANPLDPILQIGKDGVTKNVMQQAWDALEAHELIKVNVQKCAPASTREVCEELCAQVHASPVQCIGQKFVLYRQAREKEKRHIVLP